MTRGVPPYILSSMRDEQTRAKYRKYQQNWRAAHPEQARESNRKYRKAHPGKNRVNLRNHNRRTRLRAIVALGGRCIWCGFADERALQFDHIIAILQSRLRPFSTYQIAMQILKGSEDFQLLCANCNWIKRMDNQEHHPRIDSTDTIIKAR